MVSMRSRTGADRETRANSLLRWLAILGAVSLLVFLTLPLVSLVWRMIRTFSGIDSETTETLRQALTLTITSSLISLAVVVLLGTPLAYLLARRRFRGAALIETLIDLPMILPPAVAGLALLMAFGRRGLVGSILDEQWGITIGFTTTAVILAQVFVATPFYVRATRSGFSRVARELEDAAADLGASPARVLWSITLPMARPAISAGAVLAWARAVGEFGATIMFAGSIAGRTETMPLAVYGRYGAGDLSTALLLAVILLGSAMLVLLAVRLTGGRTEGMAG